MWVLQQETDVERIRERLAMPLAGEMSMF